MKTKIKIEKIQIETWLCPADHLSIEEAVEKIKSLGMNVIAIDNDNRKILVHESTK